MQVDKRRKISKKLISINSVAREDKKHTNILAEDMGKEEFGFWLNSFIQSY